MKEYNIDKLEYVNSGAFGHYFKLNEKQGIKVIRDLRYSSAWKEYKILQKFSKSGFTPKPFEVVKVLVNHKKSFKYRYGTEQIQKGEYRGIVMEHIDGIELTNYDRNYDEKYRSYPRPKILRDIYYRLCENLEQNFKAYIGDRHGENVLVVLLPNNQYKLYVIDLSPDSVNL